MKNYNIATSGRNLPGRKITGMIVESIAKVYRNSGKNNKLAAAANNSIGNT